MVIAAANLIAALVRKNGALLPWCIAASLAYVAFLVFRTWKLVRPLHDMSPLDATLCRWSGVLGMIPATFLLSVLLTMEHQGYDPERYFFSYGLGWFLFQFLSEAGLVLTLACLIMPKAANLAIPPRWLWKIVCVPFFIVYIVYVAGSLTAGFGESTGARHLN